MTPMSEPLKAADIARLLELLASAETARATYQEGFWRLALVWHDEDNRRCTTFLDPVALLDAAERLEEAEKALREIADKPYEGTPWYELNGIARSYFASHPQETT